MAGRQSSRSSASRRRQGCRAPRKNESGKAEHYFIGDVYEQKQAPLPELPPFPSRDDWDNLAFEGLWADALGGTANEEDTAASCMAELDKAAFTDSRTFEETVEEVEAFIESGQTSLAEEGSASCRAATTTTPSSTRRPSSTWRSGWP